jgi:hypothetical protein
VEIRFLRKGMSFRKRSWIIIVMKDVFERIATWHGKCMTRRIQYAQEQDD